MEPFKEEKCIRVKIDRDVRKNEPSEIAGFKVDIQVSQSIYWQIAAAVNPYLTNMVCHCVEHMKPIVNKDDLTDLYLKLNLSVEVVSKDVFLESIK